MTGWIGCDLDGTLAEYVSWTGHETIGAPIPAMVARVKAWLKEGKDVRIFTARVGDGDQRSRRYIQEWCLTHIGKVLPITCQKDYAMVTLYDDRCVRVETNTGRLLSPEG